MRKSDWFFIITVIAIFCSCFYLGFKDVKTRPKSQLEQNIDFLNNNYKYKLYG